jgi:hypothetical protein
MTPPNPGAAPVTDASGRPDETTGLPGLRTWRAVYLVVFGCVILWVLLLLLLTVTYS